MSSKSIAILIHQRDGYPTYRRHLIWYLVECWKDMGINIEIIKGIPSSAPEFDLLIPHIDLTRVPIKYTHFMDLFPKVLNRNLVDISKRKISKNLLSEVSQYNGPVIVKTDANYGGIPEMRHRSKGRKLQDKFQKLLKPKLIKFMKPVEYQVYDSIKNVPGSVWRNPNLVVEKFIPERDKEHYCMRTCFFLGEVVFGARVYSKSKIIKGSLIDFVEKSEIPAQIEEYRKSMTFDFGKFDYVIHEGTVHILDANKTPGIVSSEEINMNIANQLAKGIDKYL